MEQVIKMKIAEDITLKNILNCYLIGNLNIMPKREGERVYFYIPLQASGAKLKIGISYYSKTMRHQFELPPRIVMSNDSPRKISIMKAIKLLVEQRTIELNIPHTNKAKFMQQLKNSHANLKTSLGQLKIQEIAELFASKLDFVTSESGVLAGHQMHPSPKSCVGFDETHYNNYYPEFRKAFQLHYFWAKNDCVLAMSNHVDVESNLFLKSDLANSLNITDGYLIPLHPWQALHLKSLPAIQRMLSNNTLNDLGAQGEYFNATSSVRSVYAQNSPYMLKLSLNVMITNSVRMQYERELYRAIAVSKFWQTEIGLELNKYYPQFTPITDPGFMCLHENGSLIEESAVLMRENPFRDSGNNVTCLASLCQDNPYRKNNRFNSIIPNIAHKYALDHTQAAYLWFNTFLTICIEPLLWLFCQHGVALEAHQQNLLLKLDDDGLPKHAYYRDSQGYYVTENVSEVRSQYKDIYSNFASGSYEFISHHFSYYLIMNSVIGVINALGYSGLIEEERLIKCMQDFILDKQRAWPKEKNKYLNGLLNNPTLPIKDNLATKLFDLDELTASLEEQSVYNNIPNPFLTTNSI